MCHKNINTLLLLLAVRGNEMAQVEQYTAAIQLFTEAISLDPTDFRYVTFFFL